MVRLFYFSALLLILGCEKNDGINGQNSDNFDFFYSKNSGWSGLSQNVNINSEGRLLISELKPQLNFSRVDTIYLNKADYSKVKELVRELTKLSVQEKYGFNKTSPSDLPITKIKFSFNSNSDSTYVYGSPFLETPKQIEELIVFVNSFFEK
ncbi:MAG: hypothetical protein GY834_06345 [Bacteroidetes bacterium]|nr:hypothetical protein [Bacteroidota bacterium]